MVTRTAVVSHIGQAENLWTNRIDSQSQSGLRSVLDIALCI